MEGPMLLWFFGKSHTCSLFNTKKVSQEMAERKRDVLSAYVLFYHEGKTFPETYSAVNLTNFSLTSLSLLIQKQMP